MSSSFDSGSTRDHDRTCAECGYSLRGLPFGTPCPECGEPTVRQQEEVEPVLPEHVHQGRVLVDQGEAFTDHAPSRGSTRRPSCSGCGYDFTGLPSAGRCPECGRPYGGQKHRLVSSWVQLLPDAAILSPSWRSGTLVLFISSIAYSAFSVFSLYGGQLSSATYALTMTMITAAWALGIWMVLPGSLQAGSIWRDWLRRAARVLQLAWPLSMLSTWVAVEGVVPEGLGSAVSFLLDLAAFAGFVLVLVAFGIMTRDMGLRSSSKRLTAAMWILLPAGLLAMVLPVPTVADPGFVNAGPFPIIILSILLIPHYTIAFIVILTVFDLLSFGHWTVEHDRFLADRPERIAAKKAAIAEGVEWVPDADRDDSPAGRCSACGYDLRGHGAGAPCPECGSLQDQAMEYPARPVVNRDDVPGDDPDDIPLA